MYSTGGGSPDAPPVAKGDDLDAFNEQGTVEASEHPSLHSPGGSTGLAPSLVTPERDHSGHT